MINSTHTDTVQPFAGSRNVRGELHRLSLPEARHRDLALPPEAQFERFAGALFPENESSGQFIEVRAIETWTECDKKISRVVAQQWLTSKEFAASFETFRRLNQTANIFVGVNPRAEKQGTKAGVRQASCFWADIDHREAEDVLSACTSAGFPEPSIVVASGHGTHVYYLLDEAFAFNTPDDVLRFEEACHGFQRSIGADTTRDVTRLLRVPGTLNTKDLQNGVSPVPCVLLRCDSARRYPAALFLDRWRAEDKPRRQEPLDTPYLAPGRTAGRIRGLVNYLANEDVADRSRRDFGVVAGLLRLGLRPEEVWPLVRNHSKFATSGERYFQITIRNAQRALGGESFFE